MKSYCTPTVEMMKKDTNDILTLSLLQDAPGKNWDWAASKADLLSRE